ncbi:unannotated protein [freshwater metagenome]|uniref:Unannotated protein n=1 Tax=freshwater metagenome TaxID=449393 RepID=A0A6J7BSZ5_9ZZZZ
MTVPMMTIAGRFMTAAASHDQAPDSFGFKLPRRILALSTLCPSNARTAGNAIMDAKTANNTTLTPA